jgi:hypothetical protein
MPKRKLESNFGPSSMKKNKFSVLTDYDEGNEGCSSEISEREGWLFIQKLIQFF